MAVTRDSVIWWFGMIGAALTALAAVSNQLPAAWQPYLLVAATVVGTVSGWMATSILPGKNDATKASANGAAKMLLPFVLVGALAASACRPPAEYKTEPEKQLWYASQVLQVIHDVQRVSISINKTNPEILSTDTTRLIVNFCEASAKVIRSAPEGWAKMVLDDYLKVKAKLPAALLNNVTVAVPLAKLEAMLRTFAGVVP